MTSMTLRERRGRVEAAALLLGRVRWLLERTHSRLLLLGDIDTARIVNRIITMPNEGVGCTLWAALTSKTVSPLWTKGSGVGLPDAGSTPCF